MRLQANRQLKDADGIEKHDVVYSELKALEWLVGKLHVMANTCGAFSRSCQIMN